MNPAARDAISGPSSSELTPLTEALPGWATKDYPPLAKRAGLRAWLFGKAPNKQHRLFIFEERGHDSHVFACRLLLLLQAVYVSLVAMTFVPDVAKAYGSTSFTAIYCVVALLPTIGIARIAATAVPLAIHLGSVGTFRNRRLVAKVLRENKAERAVRLLETLYSLRAQAVARAPPSTENTSAPNIKHRRSTIVDSDARTQLALTFDLYDADGSGSIGRDELGALLTSLGRELSAPELAALEARIDSDGDGEVSRDEFLTFMAAQEATAANDSNIEATAEAIFRLFDDDASSSLSHHEFRLGLERFGVDIDADELTILVEELDSDGDGTISLAEFQQLLKTVHDREEEVAELMD